MLATLVVETVGTQEYLFDAEQFVARFSQAYGTHAAQQVGTALGHG